MSTKLERTASLEKLQSEFASARGIFVTDINKITVDKMTSLRAEFRKKGLRYIVVKNSLARIAFDRCGMSAVSPYLKGAIGVAIATKEATAPAKVIREFHKGNKDLLSVKAAFVEGTLFDGAQADRLADLPSREVLLSQMLSCLKAPMSNLAGALNGVLGKLVGTLEAVKAQKESAS